MGEDHLGDGARGVAGDVADGDVSLAGGGDVDDVMAGGEDADISQLGQLVDDFPGEAGFVGQDDFGGGCAGDGFGGGRAVVDGAGAEGLQVGPAQVAGVVGMAIEKDDLHGSHLLGGVADP